MANGYRVTIDSIATDGTNFYVSMSINDGVHTFPPVTPVFPVSGTLVREITAYAQNIATTGPTLAPEFAALVSSSVTG